MTIIINAPIISQKYSQKLVCDIFHPLIEEGEINLKSYVFSSIFRKQL